MPTIPASSKLIVAFVAILYAGCTFRSAPESATEAYINAIWDGRCADARHHLSARTDRALEYIRANPQRRQESLPVEEYYCNRFSYENCRLSGMTLATLDSARAVVEIPCGKTQDSFLPGWPSVFLKYEPRAIELVLEEDGWKVVEPFVVRMVEVREREDDLRQRALEEMRVQRSRQVQDPFTPDGPR